MLNCYTSDPLKAIPIQMVTAVQLPAWLETQSAATQHWLNVTQFKAEVGSVRLIADEAGNIKLVVVGGAPTANLWDWGGLALQLPEATYTLTTDVADPFNAALAWGLGAYQFTRYKQASRQPAKLLVQAADLEKLTQHLQAIYLVRDCITTPADNMGPSELAVVAEKLAQEHHASFKQIVGDDLLIENYPSIHTVGRAADDAPRLVDITWGDEKHPKLTLVGKGVCFDTGGLDLKPAPFMLLMKKDMGGAANVLGLAKMIMSAKLPVRLRVLIPMVENSISGNAYRPGDVIKSRKGTTIEVGNTDAEGRVVLADALTEAVRENPDLIIDMSTLTGAARVALGTELPALFSNHDAIAESVIKHGIKQYDFVWRLPLFKPYRELINSGIADINNNTAESYAGAITAALFLQEFVPETIPWLHFDIMAWNVKTKPGRPAGGEAMGIRALFAFLSERYY